MKMIELLRDLAMFAYVPGLDVRLETECGRTLIQGRALHPTKDNGWLTYLYMYAEAAAVEDAVGEKLYVPLDSFATQFGKEFLITDATFTLYKTWDDSAWWHLHLHSKFGVLKVQCTTGSGADEIIKIPPLKLAAVNNHREIGALEPGIVDLLKYWNSRVSTDRDGCVIWESVKDANNIDLECDRYARIPFLKGVDTSRFRSNKFASSGLIALFKLSKIARSFEVAYLDNFINVRVDSGSVKYDFYLMH